MVKSTKLAEAWLTRENKWGLGTGDWGDERPVKLTREVAQ